MKKTLFFMMQKVLGSKVLIFSVVFFFMGMVNASAQYVSPDEAISILKAEIQQLEADALNAPPVEAHEIAFQYLYFRAVAYDIHEGAEIGAAIANNQPAYKGVYQAPGLTYFVSDDTFKSSLSEAVIEIEGLLTD